MITNTDEMLDTVIKDNGSYCTINSQQLFLLDTLVSEGFLVRGDSLGEFTNNHYIYFLNDNQNNKRLKEWL